MRWLFVVVMVLASCATTTPQEKIESGITRQAFGAPLVFGGVVGGLGAVAGGAASVALPAEVRGSFTGVAVTLAIGSLVDLVIGVPLLVSGRGLVDDGLNAHAAPSHTVAPSASSKDDEEEAPKTRRERTKCMKGWDCPPDDEQ
jgi:hypothetical protein